MCVLPDYELRMRLIFEQHDSRSASHIGIADTLAKALDKFWVKQSSKDDTDFCERCVVCR
jgi:hypothetical protein